ncbi:MAG: transglycosylase SLT domain-containing protein [Xanthomonadales bacterium]|nr:transglycosylase SLT domain-containing protein [Xanthomonadales bacterium]NIN60042.1 transglycosylase SLT domain-containing protein [Xanthomonadales bacterium]NIN75410.1 transglycosylase SLT domain-containing protein [Xanthomonadales bacterium]NIO14233.1 transglycosylase SLT domain-containing protein [Xanthomonadales bacterium]NIP12435.1 transglycosylase SLT domain-containing protein [Xanthomonadales bacterium]
MSSSFPRTTPLLSILPALWLAVACGEGAGEPPAIGSGETATESSGAITPEGLPVDLEAVEASAGHPAELMPDGADPGLTEGRERVNTPWTGDFDGMVERRFLRVLTVYRPGGYYLDAGQERGVTYELARQFEEFINQRLNRGHLRVHVVLLPLPRDQLLPALIEGYGDLISAGLRITPELEARVDFGMPLNNRPISEVLVTGPSAPEITRLEDLAGVKVQVRASSSYRRSLERLNQRLAEAGRAQVRIAHAPEVLEDIDLMEMVDAGLFPATFALDWEARFWAGQFTGLTVREEVALQEGLDIAWAMREDSPLLLAEVNAFTREHRQGTLIGNVILNRYLKSDQWLKSAVQGADYERYQSLRDLFLQYGGQYEMDHLLLLAQGYQESRLDQDKRSPAGAVGVMQLLPSTASDRNVGIPDIHQLEPNIHAGVKYMSFLRARYFNDPDMSELNKTLFALAAYNAGPARVARLRVEAAERGLDPDRWFNQVEVVAAQRIGRETVQYVSSIFKYFVAYRELESRMSDQAEIKGRASDGTAGG